MPGTGSNVRFRQFHFAQEASQLLSAIGRYGFEASSFIVEIAQVVLCFTLSYRLLLRRLLVFGLDDNRAGGSVRFVQDNYQEGAVRFRWCRFCS
jgi:hypothetical protein